MDFEAFSASLNDSLPPKELSYALKGLWYDAKGDWNLAHDFADKKDEGGGAWVHAYLHRKEGDEWNAGYWYRRAGHPFPKISLEEEWKEIAIQLLKNQ